MEILNRGVLWLCCVACGKRLARDRAAAAEDRASSRDPSQCGACDPAPAASLELVEAWAGL